MKESSNHYLNVIYWEVGWGIPWAQCRCNTVDERRSTYIVVIGQCEVVFRHTLITYIFFFWSSYAY